MNVNIQESTREALREALWVAASRPDGDRDERLAALLARVEAEGLLPQVGEITATWERSRPVWEVEDLLAKDDWQGALDALSALDPSEPHSTYLHAYVLVRLGQLGEAEELVASLPADDERFRSVVDAVEEQRGERAERAMVEERQAAVRLVEQALAEGDAAGALGLLEGFDAEDGHATYLRACALVQLGDLDAAEELVSGAAEGDGRFE